MFSDWSLASLSASDDDSGASSSAPPTPRELVHRVPVDFCTAEPHLYVVDYSLDGSPVPNQCRRLDSSLPSTLVVYDEHDHCSPWQARWASVFLGVSLFPTYYVSGPGGTYRLDGDFCRMASQLTHVLCELY
jgi:hypothetical protein